MMKTLLVLVIMSISNAEGTLSQDLESRIVEGYYADIRDFGYAAYLGIHCERKEENTTDIVMCGSSILNQVFLLTAAHCLVKCKKSSFISVNVGNENKRQGFQTAASKFVTHRRYGFPGMANDIGLIKLKETLEFGDNIYRVVLMRSPPYEEVAVVSGWGLIDEINPTKQRLLKFTTQRIWSHRDCKELIPNVPKATICAGEKRAHSYASFGDSGGALVVQKYIQIGIVSYKIVELSRSFAVYTNVSYYMTWIRVQMKNLSC